jgi:hypothetical protein
MYNGKVRTTVEIRPEHRAKLLELAAKRGEKGFSGIVAEALDVYFAEGRDADRVRRLRKLRGVLSDAEAKHLRNTTAAVRKFWR